MFSRLLISVARRRRLVGAVAAVTSGALAATLVVAVDFPDLPDPLDWGRPDTRSGDRGAPDREALDALPRGADPDQERAATTAATVVWPKAATTTVTLPAGGSVGQAVKAKVGGLEVSVAPVEATAEPTRVRLETFDRSASRRANVDGPLLGVTQDGSGGGSATVRVTVGYDGFKDAFGGQFGSRLGLVRLPDCAVNTPEVPGCTPQAVASANDTEARTLSATVAIGNTVSLLAATATESSSQGDFTATALSPSSSWNVSPSSGAFTWSYPLRVPPVPGGADPGGQPGLQLADGGWAHVDDQQPGIVAGGGLRLRAGVHRAAVQALPGRRARQFRGPVLVARQRDAHAQRQLQPAGPRR